MSKDDVMRADREGEITERGLARWFAIDPDLGPRLCIHVHGTLRERDVQARVPRCFNPNPLTPLVPKTVVDEHECMETCGERQSRTAPPDESLSTIYVELHG